MSWRGIFWLGPDDLFVPAGTFVVPNEVWGDDIASGQRLWFGFEDEDERGLCDDASGRNEQNLIEEATRSWKWGVPVLAKRVGQFVRAFRLWDGPPRKLSDWRQLASGHSMMLSPVPCEKEEELAFGRASYLSKQGVGTFAVETRDDGSLWVSKG